MTNTKHVQSMPPELEETLERLLERVRSNRPMAV